MDLADEHRKETNKIIIALNDTILQESLFVTEKSEIDALEARVRSWNLEFRKSELIRKMRSNDLKRASLFKRLSKFNSLEVDDAGKVIKVSFILMIIFVCFIY